MAVTWGQLLDPRGLGPGLSDKDGTCTHMAGHREV